ncbi:MAG TPA: hypothetical protein HPP56_00610 [Nitrospirae bacterium]|nr:hypothetical protein [Nitrospirota bacterium]
MKIKKFYGQNFKEALEAVKKEFGPDAIIINQKEIKSSLFGITNKKSPTIELTAAIDQGQASASVDIKSTNSLNEEIIKELKGLKEEIGFLKETLRPVVPSLKITKDKKGLFNLLLRQGVDTQLALVLVERCQDTIDSLKNVIIQDVKIQGLSPVEEKGMIFIGPPGVGKTTTLSKIAYMIQSKKKPVSLITLDDSRISTIAHFKEMGKMLHCPIRSVKKINELPRIVYKEIGKMSVLIDTPGYDYKAILEGINDIFPSGFPLKKCFVVDTSMNEQSAIKFWQDCFVYGIDSIGFTKLDLAMSFGNLYNLSLLTGRPLSFMTTGPDIPHDIRIPSKDFFANLVIGGV